MKKLIVSAMVAALGLDAAACTIPLGIVYTPNAITAYGGEAALLSAVSTAVSQTNASFSNSGVSITITPYLLKASWGENWDKGAFNNRIPTILTNLATDASVRQWRNALGLSAVMGVIGANFPSTEPWGQTIGNSENDPSKAFSVLQATNMTGTRQYSAPWHPGYTFAHEFGHQFGTRHQISGGSLGDDAAGYTLGHGMWWRLSNIVSGVSCVHTLMAYDSVSGANGSPATCLSGTDERQLYFAGPTVNFITVSGGSNTVAYNPDWNTTYTPPVTLKSGNSSHSDEVSVINSKAIAICAAGATKLPGTGIIFGGPAAANVVLN